MTRLVLAALALLSLAPRGSRAGGGPSNADVAAEARKKWLELKGAEQAALESLLRTQQGKSQKEALRESEKAWEAYRDRQCAFEEATFLGGSGGPAARFECLARETRRRSDELSGFLGPEDAPEAKSCKEDDAAPAPATARAVLDGIERAVSRDDAAALASLASCRFWVGRAESGEVRQVQPASVLPAIAALAKGLDWPSASFDGPAQGELGRFVVPARKGNDKQEFHVEKRGGRFRWTGYATSSDVGYSTLH